MIYSYPFCLARRAVVATMDLSAMNLHMLRTDHWLSNSKNVVQIWLSGPAWLPSLGLPRTAMSEGAPPLRLEEWSVDELAARVTAEDAAGLAELLRSNSVSGRDFAVITDFVGDLRCTPFAARKLYELKQQFAAL